MFSVDTLSIKVHFAHRQVVGDKNVSHATFCFITYYGEKDPCMVGVAYCSRQDQFNKETGRKLALKRVLSRNFTQWDKIQRGIIWNAYFGRKNG